MTFILRPTTEQLNYLHRLRRDLRLTDGELELVCREVANQERRDLTRTGARLVIDRLEVWRLSPVAMRRWFETHRYIEHFEQAVS